MANLFASAFTAIVLGFLFPAPAAAAPRVNPVALARFDGIYQGPVERRLLTGQKDTTRIYRIAMNADKRNGTVWIYDGGKLLYVLLFSGRFDGDTFIGKTRPVEVGGVTYRPDNIRLTFAPDGRTVRWYHNDGYKDGSGLLKRVQ